MHTQGGTHKRRSVATAGVLLFKGPQARQCTHKAVHTQGGKHKRRSVATAGVMLVEGPQARRCTHKAEHTKGGLWPPQESCYLRGHKQGGAHTRRCTHKAEHTKGGLWPPQESCYLRGHRQGGAHTRRNTMRFAISKPKFGLCRIECICVCTDCLLSCLLYFVCRWEMLSDYPVGWCLDRASPEERVLGGNRPAGQKPGDRLS